VQYFCDGLKPWIARRDRLERFVIRRDPRDISRIWVLDPDGSAYLEVPYRTLSHPPISVWERSARRPATAAIRWQRTPFSLAGFLTFASQKPSRRTACARYAPFNPTTEGSGEPEN